METKKINKNLKFFMFILGIFVNINFIIAVPNFQVTSFSCSPSENVINSVFSCTAQIKNIGDAAGSVSTVTLYSDSSNWLENSNYPQSSGTSVNPGQTTEVTFTGLKAVKSGNNGFSKIMLDSVTDNYVADQNKKVNVINVVVIVNNSLTTAVMNSEVTTTTEVISGGNIDVTLTFTSNSGGCNIEEQTNPKIISGMTDGSKQSRTWTIIQGTSGTCRFTISAAAEGIGGIASKIDSTPSSITCSDCPSGGSNGGSGSGGGGSGGGGEEKDYMLGALVLGQEVELSDGEVAKFNISKIEHKLTLKNHTTTSALITIESEKQTFDLILNQEKNIDLNGDGSAEIFLKLKSVNIVTNKVIIIVSPIVLPSNINPLGTEEIENNGKKGEKTLNSNISPILIIVIILIILIAIVSLICYLTMRKKRRRYF
jgi:hypothetical protein